MSNCNAGRSRRPWCYHKRGVSLDDNLGSNLDDDFASCETPPQSLDNTNNHSIDQTGDHSADPSEVLYDFDTDKDKDTMAEDDNEHDVSSTLQKRFGRLLSCEDMSDVHFIVGSGDSQTKLRIPAHKLVLSVSSPVFKAMFYGPFAQQKNTETNIDDISKNSSDEDIILPDIEPIVFLEFLRYLYSDDIKLTRENAIALLYSAKKYDIPTLQKVCVEFVKYSICEKNCLLIWMSSRLFDDDQFEYLAIKVVERYASFVCLSPDFLRLDRQSLSELINNDLLRIDEIDLFRAVTRWAKNECLRNGVCPTRHNIREVLGDTINLIRFPLMSAEQISKTVANEGILEDDVIRALLSSSRTWPRISKSNCVTFSNTQRVHQRLQSNLLTVQRFTSYDNQLPNRFTNKSLCFTSNKRIFMAGIGVYGPRKACTFYIQASFSIIKSGCQIPTIIDHSEKSVMLKCDATQPIINIKLDQPFEIEPNIQYEIIAKITPTNRSTSVVRSKFNPHLYYTRPNQVNYYYGTGGLFAAKIKASNDENIIVNFSWNTFDDSISETSVTQPSCSAPPTPNPPPRPPPPLEYSRPSKIERLKRALSFHDKNEQTKQEDKFTLLQGQIPVIMFYF